MTTSDFPKTEPCQWCENGIACYVRHVSYMGRPCQGGACPCPEHEAPCDRCGGAGEIEVEDEDD